MEKHCDNEECKNYWGCRYLNNRFDTYSKECPKNKFYNGFLVDIYHDAELVERERILKGLSE